MQLEPRVFAGLANVLSRQGMKQSQAQNRCVVNMPLVTEGSSPGRSTSRQPGPGAIAHLLADEGGWRGIQVTLYSSSTCCLHKT